MQGSENLLQRSSQPNNKEIYQVQKLSFTCLCCVFDVLNWEVLLANTCLRSICHSEEEYILFLGLLTVPTMKSTSTSFLPNHEEFLHEAQPLISSMENHIQWSLDFANKKA